MRTHGLAAGLVVAALALAACTESPETAADGPTASDAPSAASQPSTGATPAGDPDGVFDDDDDRQAAQIQLDAAVDELLTSPSVNVTFRRSTGERIDDRLFSPVLTADWFPSDEVWIGVMRLGLRSTRDILTQYLFVEGRTYVRDSDTWQFSGNWLDQTRYISQDDLAGWPFAKAFESIEASSARDDGSTTTIVAQIPNETAIDAFGIGDDRLLPSVREELADDTTMVTLQLVDGFPRELSIYGRNIGLPGAGIPQTSLDILGRAFVVMRFSRGEKTKAPAPPPPSQVDRLKTITDF